MSNGIVKRNKNPQKTKEGIRFYNQVGYIFIFLGIASLILLGFVGCLPQDYEKYNIPLFFGVWTVISLILLSIGILPLVLGKYSKKYQNWVEKEVDSYQNKMMKQAKRLIEKDIKK